MGRACWIALVATLVLVSVGTTAAAQQAEQRYAVTRLGVLPVVVAVRDGHDLFGEDPRGEPLRRLAGRWQRVLEDQLAGLDLVRIAPADRAQATLRRQRRYQDTLALANDRFDLAVERYRALAPEEAGRHLARAEQLWARTLVDLAEPRVPADGAMYRGLLAVEAGDQTEAHIAFRRMWELDTERVFQRGYYPEAVEAALRSALADQLAQAPAKFFAGRWPLERLQLAADAAKLDGWLVAAIVGTAKAPELRWQVFDRRQQAFVVTEQVPLADDAKAKVALNRALTAWHSCHVATRTDPLAPRPVKRPFAVDLGYHHVAFLRHEGTKAQFHSPGARLQLTWDATEVVSIFVQYGHMVALPDENRDLIQSFQWGRLAFGAGLYGGNQRFRAFAQAGLEAAVILTDVTMTRDVDCKHFALPHPRCPVSPVREAPLWLFGFHLDVGVRVMLAGPWFVQGSVGVATYWLDGTLINDLNYPVDGTLSLGSRF